MTANYTSIDVKQFFEEKKKTNVNFYLLLMTVATTAIFAGFLFILIQRKQQINYAPTPILTPTIVPTIATFISPTIIYLEGQSATVSPTIVSTPASTESGKISTSSAQ